MYHIREHVIMYPEVLENTVLYRYFGPIFWLFCMSQSWLSDISSCSPRRDDSSGIFIVQNRDIVNEILSVKVVFYYWLSERVRFNNMLLCLFKR